jgi:hypothetical protein
VDPGSKLSEATVKSLSRLGTLREIPTPGREKFGLRISSVEDMLLVRLDEPPMSGRTFATLELLSWLGE